MRVTVLSWMRDEADMVPFFLRHYAFADDIIVWDNESKDGTREMLEADPRVEVREWRTGGVMNDVELTRMKSEEYRRTGEGWKVVVDADELVWHPDMRGFLAGCDAEGVTLPRTEGYDMVAEAMPEDDGRSLMTDLVREGWRNPMYDKWCVLRECVGLRYWHGAHRLEEPPKGRAVVAPNARLKLLHYRYMGLNRTVRKAMAYVQSPENVAMQTGGDNCDVRTMAERWHMRWSSRAKVL